MDEARATVAVAGASGYVGSALGPVLAPRFDTVGLSRRARPPGHGGYARWRSTDLFSLADAERGLEGCSHAVYLVHSMLPTDRLSQGEFEDFDLICADNFGRAARHAGLDHIVYLGGLVPGETNETNRETNEGLSRHLASRLETERALASHGVPVTTLRAGLVIGPGGSSFEMMRRLVQRLPAMLCPEWTQTKTQPIALADIVQLLAGCVGRTDLTGSHDVGCPDVVSYRQMMQATAEALGQTRRMFPVPLMTTGLSRLWVSLITGAPKELVEPLIQSLAHPMVARDHALEHALGVQTISLRDALDRALEAPKPVPAPRPSPASTAGSSTAPPARATPAGAFVRSVQRMSLPPGRDAEWVAREYMRWLDRALWLILRVETEGDRTRFYPRGSTSRPLLELTLSPQRSSPSRQLLYVTGGLLADIESSERPRLEFRVVDGGAAVIAAIHDFAPRLPWPIYVASQAQFHLWVMHRFGRHLRRLGEAGALDDASAARG